jgi:hypothetical protein
VSENAGWYIFCNGRAVIFADKTRLTGWDRGLPQYVSKYRGFLGIVFFFSVDPERLPWTTTKTNINQESLVYQHALNLIYNTSRPVLRFLNSLYSGDEVESESAKASAEGVGATPIPRVVSLTSSTFTPPAKRRGTTITLQFPVKIADVERIRQYLKKPNLSARKIGEIAFKFYLDNEVS